MDRRAGFTLTEMLLVIAIIGIVSSIAIPFLLGRRDAARQKATEAVARSVIAECDAYVKDRNGAAGAAAMMAYVRNIPNFQYPRCKNAYAQAVTALTAAGPAVNDGEVGMVAMQVADTNGVLSSVVAVSYKHNGIPAPMVMANVPVE